MKFDISRSIYPDGKIRFIARDKDRIVRFREDTLEDIQAAIKKYKEPPPVEEEKDEGKGVSVKGEEASAGETKKEAEKEPKQFLENELKTKVQERKEQAEKSQKKKSFWDKLK